VKALRIQVVSFPDNMIQLLRSVRHVRSLALRWCLRRLTDSFGQGSLHRPSICTASVFFLQLCFQISCFVSGNPFLPSCLQCSFWTHVAKCTVDAVATSLGLPVPRARAALMNEMSFGSSGPAWPLAICAAQSCFTVRPVFIGGAACLRLRLPKRWLSDLGLLYNVQVKP